jgi:hypothetical protein
MESDANRTNTRRRLQQTVHRTTIKHIRYRRMTAAISQLPDPTEVGEDGQAPEVATTCKAAIPFWAPAIHQRYGARRASSALAGMRVKAFIGSPRPFMRKNCKPASILYAPHRGASNSVAD